MWFRRGRRRTPTPRPIDSDGRAALFLQYELLWFRTLDKDALQWQAPALSLTAQSFLLTITLAPDTSRLSRTVSASLGVVVAIVAMQLMAKHQWLLQRDLNQLSLMESTLGVPSGRMNYGWPRDAGPRTDREGSECNPLLKSTFWRRRRSYLWWQLGMGAFGVSFLACLVASLVAPCVFST